MTDHFGRHEFACGDGCGLCDPHPELVVGLEALRVLLGCPLGINSGCRCPAHNQAVGGAVDSRHMPDDEGFARAADVSTRDTTLRRLWYGALSIPAFRRGGVGLYLDSKGPRVHTDVRREWPARWARLDGRKSTPAQVLEAAAERGL